MKNKTIPKLISRPKVADLLGVCTRTVKRYEAQKLLTPYVINSRLTSYPESEVLQLVANARAAAVAA